MPYLISKDTTKIFNGLVENVELIDGADNYNLGVIEKGSLKLFAKPKTFDEIDGSKDQLGWDVNFELSSAQYFTLFQYENLKNRICTIKIASANTYLKSFKINVELNMTFDSPSGVVKITGQKYVKSLIDAIDGRLDPLAELPAPWAGSGGSST